MLMWSTNLRKFMSRSDILVVLEFDLTFSASVSHEIDRFVLSTNSDTVVANERVELEKTMTHKSKTA